MKKVILRGIVLSLAYTMVFLIGPVTIKAQTINLTVKFKPLEDRNLEVSGTIICSNLWPKGQMNVRNTVYIALEYLKTGGKYRTLPEYLNIRGGGPAVGKHILTRDEREGINAASLKVWSSGLDHKRDEGRSIEFKGKVRIPKDALTFRVVATLDHYLSGTWEAIYYKHQVAGETDIKDLQFKPPGPCKDKKLNADDDGDGVRNWRDLCPTIKGKKGLLGCPDGHSKIKTLTDTAEKVYRQEIKDFLACAKIDAKQPIVKLNFVYEGSTQYKNNEIYLSTPDRWEAYWLALQEKKCKGKIEKYPKDDPFIFTSLYHELGHFIADIIDMEDVSGSSGTHNTWTPSNPGLAFDEGRADLILYLMAKWKGISNLKIKHMKPIGKQWGKEAARDKMNNTPGAGMSTEGIVTSVFKEILPENPCVALREFLDAHWEYKKYTAAQPQNLRDWMIAYNLYKKRKARSIQEMVEFDKKSIKTLREYGITPEGFGYIHDVLNSKAIRVYDIIKDPSPNKQGEFIKFIGLKNMKNLLKVGHVNVDVDTVDGEVIKIKANSTYTVQIDNEGYINIQVTEGSVIVTAPDGSKQSIPAGSEYDWPEQSGYTGDEIDYSFSLGLPCANDQEFAISIIKSVLEEDPSMSSHMPDIVGGTTLDRETFLRDIFSSTTYIMLSKADSEFVRDLFQSVLGREPSPTEAHHWEERIRLQKSYDSILLEFLRSPEYRKIKENCYQRR